MIEQIKNSKGFSKSKDATIKSITKQLNEEEDLCCSTSGTIQREAGRVGFYAGNNVVGNINLDVATYEVTWYRNDYSDEISFYAYREVSFSDDYEFVFDPWSPVSTLFTDVVAGKIAGAGTPYKIEGAWTDRISHEYTSWKCRLGRIF